MFSSSVRTNARAHIAPQSCAQAVAFWTTIQDAHLNIKNLAANHKNCVKYVDSMPRDSLQQSIIKDDEENLDRSRSEQPRIHNHSPNLKKKKEHFNLHYTRRYIFFTFTTSHIYAGNPSSSLSETSSSPEISWFSLSFLSIRA